MTQFFAISNTGDFDNGLNFAVVCMPAIITTTDDEGSMAFVCGCKTHERADEIANMYNYFMDIIDKED